MFLDRIEIRNFRSIKDVTISFNNKGLILIGKNEAGKSNILKAIAALFKQYKVTDKDKRKRVQNEVIKSYNLSSIFKLSKEDKKEIKNSLVERYKNLDLLELKNGKTVDDYIDNCFDEFLIRIDIGSNNSPSYGFWPIDEDSGFTLKEKVYISTNGNSLSSEPSINEFSLKKYCFEECKKIYEANPYVCH